MPTRRPPRKATSRSKRPSRKSAPPEDAEIGQVARKNFGFDQLWPAQLEAIRSLLSRHDTLVVMPTGWGKSAIYQIAGLMLPHSVLIVSPLIALQKDQVDSINAGNVKAEACVINSSLKASELRESLDRVSKGDYKFVFLAPEQLRKEETVEALQRARVSMIVIDEAHCISEWGHDFRPDYLQLDRVIESLSHPVTLAMTATASERVRLETIDRLGMKRPSVFVRGFDRPNIHLRVDHFDDESKKLDAVLHQIRWAPKPGIVYVATRRTAEQIMRTLEEEGIKALFYHGGLKGSERDDIQNRFMSGDAEVIVATNAFGMGIDKADIRFVYHHDAPDSLDAYYQEIGRAGRDGERADAILFFRKEDLSAQAFHTGSGRIRREQLDQVLDTISDAEQPIAPEEIAGETDLSQRKLTSTIQKLEGVAAVEVLPSGEVQLSEDIDLEQAVEAVADQQEQRKEANQERLEQMRGYADTTTCRREYLLRYFGDEFTGPCHNCDNCEAEHPEIAVDPSIGVRLEVTEG